jgi:hypothetical protein
VLDATAVADRLSERNRALRGTATELGQTAWQYHTGDIGNAISLGYDLARWDRGGRVPRRQVRLRPDRDRTAGSAGGELGRWH